MASVWRQMLKDKLKQSNITFDIPETNIKQEAKMLKDLKDLEAKKLLEDQEAEILYEDQEDRENYYINADSRKEDKVNKRNGFYYDLQLQDPNITMSLHPNSELVDGRWLQAFGPCFERTPWFEGAEWKYRKKPLAIAFCSEDFSFNMSNQFSDVNQGNALEDIFKSAKPYAHIASTMLGQKDKLINAVKNVQKEDNLGSTLVGGLNWAGEKLWDTAKVVESTLNKALYVQGSRHTFFNGSDCNFNNLDFKFIKFSDWEYGKFVSVLDYIKNTLMPYCYGDYKPLGEGDFAKMLEKDGSTITDTVKEVVSMYCGMESAPGGFTMAGGSVLDKAFKGTLRLIIGGTYVIDNLIIKGASIVVSKVMIKDPTAEGKTCPAFAEISLSLAPASKITNRSLSRVFDPTWNGMSDSLEKQQRNYADGLENIFNLRK